MAEETKPKSQKELMIERLTAKHPDMDFSDEETAFGRIGGDYDEYDAEIERYKGREKEIMDAFDRDPRNAQFFAAMASGKDPWIAVVEHIGLDAANDLFNDPEKKAAYEEANKEYAARLAKSKSLDEEYNNNIAESIKLREQYDQQHGEETVDAALAIIDGMLKDYIMGKLTPEALDMAMKMVSRDTDLENARQEGELAGRNAKIEEKLHKQQGGDGLPAMGAGGQAAPTEKRTPNFFDYAFAAGGGDR